MREIFLYVRSVNRRTLKLESVESRVLDIRDARSFYQLAQRGYYNGTVSALPCLVCELRKIEDASKGKLGGKRGERKGSRVADIRETRTSQPSG